MAAKVLLQHEQLPNEQISMQKNNNSPDPGHSDKTLTLPTLSISKKRANIASLASDEYCDSDEDIYGDNNSEDSDETELNNNYYGIAGTASYSRLKNYAEIEMKENAKINKYYKQLIYYVIYNSLRFLFIGIIVLIVNIRHENDIQNFKNGNNNMSCCYCYNYAKFHHPTYRIDWSMCYDACNHCKSCENKNESNSECEIPHRMDMISNITIDDESCPEKLSITSFGYFVKNYLFYGIGALVMCCLYVIFMISASCIGGTKIISSGVMFIFLNIQLSLICAYCITKPYQYYLETYEYGTVNFKCYKDSLSEDIENILTLLVNCAVAFVTLPFVLCCCRCIAFRKDSYKIRKIYATVMKIILILAMLGCICGTIALTWISFKVAKKHKDESGNKDLFHNATVLVIGIDLFMVLSAFDICIFCQFCRHKINTIYMVRYSPYVTHRDWELTVSENKSMQTTSNYPQ
eukprot:162221_1